ncbi:hypothetical protein ABZP36_008332 [Zizania latifolia]
MRISGTSCGTGTFLNWGLLLLISLSFSASNCGFSTLLPASMAITPEEDPPAAAALVALSTSYARSVKVTEENSEGDHVLSLQEFRSDHIQSMQEQVKKRSTT